MQSFNSLFNDSQASNSGLVSFEREDLLLGHDGVELDFRHLSGDGEGDVVDEDDIVGSPVEGDAEVDGGRRRGVKIDATVKPDGVMFT